MTYLKDPDGECIKKCETNDCQNIVFIGVSRTQCVRCLKLKEEEIILKPIPHFIQQWPM